MRKLQSHALVMRATLAQLMPVDPASEASELRRRVRAYVHTASLVTQFDSELTRRCPQIRSMILDTLRPYVDLMGLRENQTKAGGWTDGDPVHLLWEFLSRMAYERPSLLLPDSIDGTSVSAIRDAMPVFISCLVRPIEQSR